MDTNRPIQPYKLSARENEVYAAGYADAYQHTKEAAEQHGPDFDRDMMLLFLDHSAQFRTAYAKMRLEQEAGPGPRLLSCGLCFEENGEEVHPHPDCTVRAQRADGFDTAYEAARSILLQYASEDATSEQAYHGTLVDAFEKAVLARVGAVRNAG
jgi:hypothetical protein